MRKIDLTPYIFNESTFDMKVATVNLLFNPELNHSARDLILQDKLATKIETAEGMILLEESDYTRVKTAVESYTRYGRGDAEFVSRILDAEEVNVKEV